MGTNKTDFQDEIMGRGGFSLVPNEIWLRNDLDFYSKGVWCYLLSEGPNWDSSRNNVARNLNLDKDAVTKHISILVEKGMLSVTTKTNRAQEYTIQPPSKWRVTDVDGHESPSKRSLEAVEDGHIQEYNNSLLLSSFLADENEVEKVPTKIVKQVVRPTKVNLESFLEDFRNTFLKSNRDIHKVPEMIHMLVQSLKEAGISRDEVRNYGFANEISKIKGAKKQIAFEITEKQWNEAFSTFYSDGLTGSSTAVPYKTAEEIEQEINTRRAMKARADRLANPPVPNEYEKYITKWKF